MKSFQCTEDKMSMLIFILLHLICLIRNGNTTDCTQSDIKVMNMECDPQTRRRKVVSYLANNCTVKDTNLIKPPYSVPCTCPQGQGLSVASKPVHECTACNPGTFSAGGEHVSDWGSWTDDGKNPPVQSQMITFCETYRTYVKPCEHWKASFFNDSLESGDNAKSRCMTSVLFMKKQFVAQENYVQFTYRVEGRKCYNNYAGCDGLAFFVDNKRVMNFQGNQLVWKTVKFNVSSGFHQLKWVYLKNCYSFLAPGIADKAFLQSITLIGTLEPNTQCQNCPPGTYSDKKETAVCTKCNYFEYQPTAGQRDCKKCEVDSYSMRGSAECIPMVICTQDDLLMAPEPLSQCKKNRDGVLVRTIVPEYSTVKISDGHYTLCIKPKASLPSKTVPCKCQPGNELSPFQPVKCSPCAKGMMSDDGIRCVKCPSGHVALMGMHYYWWDKDGLPTGFTSGCGGDCPSPNKDGWSPSGTHIQTRRVVGDVDSYIQSGTYEIVSNIAYIAFNCSILCNMSEPTSRLLGNHLADIAYCNLVFEVWANGSLADQVNCTKPKGEYVYKHERRRDGRLVGHQYFLNKGVYQFKWLFHQEDELKSVSHAFQAKIYNISIVGVKGGSAIACTPCASGFYSVDGNTDCLICPKGTFSKIGQSECTKCKERYFADAPGQGECLVCGATTASLPTRDGCTNSGCKYSIKEKGLEYDFSRLSRVNGSMFTVLNYQVTSTDFLRKTTDRRRSARLSIWPPYRSQFYLNLCTVLHDNTSCTIRQTGSAPRQSLPVMGCRASWWSLRDTSIGRVIGFKPKKDPATGVIVELLHGDRCHRNLRYNATIDLTCDVKAGVGSPGPENNHTQIFRPPCTYHFKWNSLYACPKCRKGDIEKVTHPCRNGTALVTLERRYPCWDEQDAMGVHDTYINCTDDDNYHLRKVKKIIEIQETVNKVLIGVGVVVIVVLIVVAGFFFFKHRDMKFKYYHTLARNKPMSRLEEEEEDFGQVEGDVFNDTRTMINS